MRPPRLNEKIVVTTPRFPNERLAAHLRGFVSDRLVISLPFIAGSPIPVRAGEKLALSWEAEPLVVGVIHSVSRDGFQAEVEVVEVLRQQRRNYFRWTVRLSVRFATVEGKALGPWQVGHTLNISGGGMCLPWNESLKAGDHLEVKMTLDGVPVGALARVASIRPNPKPPPATLVGIEFVRISEADRSRIVRFIFLRQGAAKSQ